MFSGTIKIANVDDYIQPSVQCIKPAPVNQEKGDSASPGKGKVQLSYEESFDASGLTMGQEAVPKSHPNIIRPNLSSKQAKVTAHVTLSDCLACSGCITSAETVLVEEHCIDKLLEKMKSEKVKIVLVTISPQSRAALAKSFGVSEVDCHQRLGHFFAQVGEKVIGLIDTTLAQEIAHLLCAEELTRRQKEGKMGPLLASECPGWVCYAEKVLGNSELVINSMSQVMSPQQITGRIIKRLLAQEKNTVEFLPL